MTRRRLSAGAIVLLLFALCSSAALLAQTQQRSIYASALDQNGAPVPNLGPTDFVVREDKVAREILEVVPATDPMQIMVLVDNSQAADQFTRDYREALPAFIRALDQDQAGVKHQIAIVTVAERPTSLVEYTTDMDVAIKGAQRIFSTPGSGAYLLDGIIETSQGIVKRGSQRPVIVAVTSEGPEMSDRVYTSVLEPLRASGAALHIITIGRTVNESYDRAVVIDMGTKESGGHTDNILSGSALSGRMQQVATELTHQYRVTYARPDTLIPPDQVTISAAKPGLTVRGTPVKYVRERP